MLTKVEQNISVSAVLPLIDIGRLVRWYWLIVFALCGLHVTEILVKFMYPCMYVIC